MAKSYPEFCLDCGDELELLATVPKWRKGRCLGCARALQKRYHDSYKLKLKIKCLEHYGKACACCGETEIDFLCVDHVAGNGNAHRREIFGTEHTGGSKMYCWLIRNNFPEGFQILCFNCNCAKHYFGTCPHQRKVA